MFFVRILVIFPDNFDEIHSMVQFPLQEEKIYWQSSKFKQKRVILQGFFYLYIQEYIYKEVPAFDLKDVAENLKLIREKINVLETGAEKNLDNNKISKEKLEVSEDFLVFQEKLELSLQTQESINFSLKRSF